MNFTTFKLDFIRNLTPEVKGLLIKINKDKKSWYTQANKEADGKLFKTSFHDYSHSAPKTLGDVVGKPMQPLPLDNASENIARHLEDSVLQGLPLALPKSQITPNISTIYQARQLPEVDEAYKALHQLGKYSVEKKNGLNPGTYTDAKVMLNKFNYNNNQVANFDLSFIRNLNVETYKKQNKGRLPHAPDYFPTRTDFSYNYMSTTNLVNQLY